MTQVYSWSEISKHAYADDAWLVIKGKVYDVSEFLPRHPGGDQLLMACGRDSTQLYESHHPTYVVENEQMLEKYYIGEAEGNNGSFLKQTDFYPVMKKRVEKYFKDNNLQFRDSPTMYFKTFLAFALYFLSYYGCFFYFKNIIACSLCAIAFGYGTANMGMNVMHDANHGGYSNNSLVNRVIGWSFDFTGGSSFVWRMIHGVGHHTYTNIDGLDPDIQTAEPHFRRIKESQKVHNYYQYQHLYLPFLYLVLVPELFIRDFVSVVNQSFNGVKFQPLPTREAIVFFVSKMWYVLHNFVVPAMLLPAWKVILFYSLSAATSSLILVLMFQVNHVTDKSNFYKPEKSGDVNADWAMVQASGSSNFAIGSWFWNHVSGGLNHQIEHHLFPYISHVHYPAIQPIVQQTCKEYNVSYQYYRDFFDAVGGHFRLLKKMGRAGIAYKPRID